MDLNSIIMIIVGVVVVAAMFFVAIIVSKTRNSQAASATQSASAREEELQKQIRELHEAAELARLRQENMLKEAHGIRKEEQANLKEIQEKARRLEAEVIELKASNEAQQREADLKLQSAQELAAAQLQAAIDAGAAELKNQESELNARAAAQRREIEMQRDEALAQNEQLRMIGEAQARAAQAKIEGFENEYKVKMAELTRSKDMQIEELVERLEESRDMRSKLTVKLLGESLEQHCETSFNQIRATAFRNAEFSKDNTTIEGTKGDYIYREYTDDGIEIISIMFEMKTEAVDSIHTHTNESHFAKLDRDRAKKQCEYAVLVSMLEPESEYYNTGIVDVSHKYPKMYVVRPQFFITIISLLRNAALDSLATKQQLRQMLQSQPEVQDFEDKLDKLKGEVSHNNENAQAKCDSAVKQIDTAIAKLQRIREDIEMISTYTERANIKLDALTIRKLTHGNPAMREQLKQARQEAPVIVDAASVEDIQA